MDNITGSLQYAIRLVEQLEKEDNVTWYADHPALPGCHAVGRTAGEALDRLEQAREAWIAVSRQLGDEIPEPIEEERILIQYALRKELPRAEQAAGLFDGVEPIEIEA